MLGSERVLLAQRQRGCVADWRLLARSSVHMSLKQRSQDTTWDRAQRQQKPAVHPQWDKAVH